MKYGQQPQLSPTDELCAYIDSRTSDNSVYSTPSEYLRDLIRRDMETQGVVGHIVAGIDNIKHDRFVDQSILDIGNSDR